ncbi:MAG: hypothetical protein MJZ66_08610 [Bacteroidales bacterium]|nr:hypothetical protein [Bacteroidales bacterium]
MRNTLLIILVLMLAPFAEASAQAPFQSRPTAITIPRNNFEISAFSPSRYGFGKKSEVFSTVFLDWKLPNLGLKHTWIHKPVRDGEGFFKERDIYFATVHNIDYPTMFFKSVQKHKPSFISDTCIVPNVITMRNEARVSLMLKKKTLCDPANFFLTLRAGVKNSFKIKKDATMPPVDRQLWYRETVVCLDTIVWFAGLDLDIHITDKLNLLVDGDFYSVDWNVKDWSGENKIFLYGYFGLKGNVMLQAGVKFLYGTIYNDFKFMAYPMLDVSYFFGIKKKRDVGLFG